MKFNVLGPIEAIGDAGPVDIGRPLNRAVLATLLVAVPQVVAKDAIIAQVWGPDAGDGSLSSLQAIISRLRSILGTAAIVTQAPGYRLAVYGADVDAGRFRGLLTDARDLAGKGATREARALVVQALSLWRSDAYADVAADFALEESARLFELRLGAVELAVDLDLTLGLHQELAERLPVLVRDHPLREGLRATLMLALYRCGRQAEALRAYDEGREILLDELGIDPGPELQRLHGQILRQDPSLAPGSVTVPGTRDRPTRAEPTRNHNLPGSLNPLIGRSAQLKIATDALRNQRLLTIVGTGGIGKTRLALETASLRQDSDGPWLVELAPLNTGALLIETIGHAMGISVPSGLQSLVAVLQQRQLLLVLDNCEQIVDDVADLVTAVLEQCSRVQILATSRQTLGVPGELVLDLQPLRDTDAVALFVTRASAAAPGLALDAADTELLSRLCAGLDYLPLAIELAAAQCRALSVRQLAENLDDRFALLGGANRGNRRHATMTAAVAWSYDSLSAAERDIFGSLAVLEGTFDLEGASAVTGRRAVVGVLLTLIDKSMVAVVGGDPRRYRILETLRQYAAERRDPAATKLARARIVAWVCSVADVADAELHGPKSREWMDRLDHDKDTIRAALDWAADDPATRLRIAAGMVWFWFRRGHITEGLWALEPSTPTTAAGPPVGIPILISRWIGIVLLSYLAGDYQRLTDGLANAGDLVGRCDDAGAMAYALCTIAFFEAGAGQTSAALAHAGAGYDLAQAASSPQRAAEALQSMGMAHLRSGNPAEAERCLTAAVAQARACGYLWCAVSSMWLLSKVKIAGDDFSDDTVDRLLTMIEVCESDANLTSWLVGLVSLAYVWLRRGELAMAAELTGIADRQSELIGFAPDVMDPVETSSYRSHLTTAMAAEGLSAVYARGRALPTDDAFRRVRELAARSQQRRPDPSDRPGRAPGMAPMTRST